MGSTCPLFYSIKVSSWEFRLVPKRTEGASIMQITTVGVDLAKNVVFQVHGVDDHGHWMIMAM
jgi:hypothetical protein